MPALPDDFLPQEGTRLQPGLLRRVLLRILAHTRVEGGHGIQVARLPGGGHAISLDNGRELRIAARITAAPAFAPTAPASGVYTYQAYGNDGLTKAGVLPALGRPTQNDEW